MGSPTKSIQLNIPRKENSKYQVYKPYLLSMEEWVVAEKRYLKTFFLKNARDEKPVISRLMEFKKTVEYICSTKCRGKEFFMNIFWNFWGRIFWTKAWNDQAIKASYRIFSNKHLRSNKRLSRITYHPRGHMTSIWKWIYIFIFGISRMTGCVYHLLQRRKLTSA